MKQIVTFSRDEYELMVSDAEKLLFDVERLDDTYLKCECRRHLNDLMDTLKGVITNGAYYNPDTSV